MDSFWIVPLILVCLVLQGLFSGGELALVASNINRIRWMHENGRRGAAGALWLLERPHWFISTTLTGTNLCVVTSTTAATVLFITLLGRVQGEMVSALVMIPLLLILGEIIPKSILQQHPEQVAVRLAGFIRLASWLFFPMVFLISRISRRAIILSTGQKDLAYAPYITKDGLKYILGTEESPSDIQRAEKDMVRRIFDFTEITAGEIMVPLSALTALPITAPLHEAARLFAAKMYLRIPVYRDQMFNIVGICHYFDLLEALRRGPGGEGEPTVETCLNRNIFYVPETKPAQDLLIELHNRGERMAAVVDEYGGVVGILTIEDILEEIVGEIDDGYESGQRMIKRIAPGRFLVNPRISLERIRQWIPLEDPEGHFETLGGYLLQEMGKIPKRKETFRKGDLLFVIEDADSRSIKEVLVILGPEARRLSSGRTTMSQG